MIMLAASGGVKPLTGQPQRLHRAPLWRNPTSDCHCQGTNPPSRRPQSVHRGPSKREEAPKKLIAIGSLKRILPLPCMNSACERSGKFGARAHRKLASAQLTRSSNAQHRTAFKKQTGSELLVFVLPALLPLLPPLCWHPNPKQVGCRASSAAPRTAVTARKLQLHSHAQHAGPSIFNASPNRASDYSPLCPRSLRC